MNAEKEVFKTRMKEALKLGQATYELHITEQLESGYLCKIYDGGFIERAVLAKEELMECLRDAKGASESSID